MPSLPSGFHFFERGWLSSNSLLLQDGDQAVLFDTGYVTHSQQLLNLIHHRLGSQSLNEVINTHLHSDHCGGNALLQSHFPELKTSIPATQYTDVENWTPSALTYELTGQTCPSFVPSAGLKSGSTLSFCGTQWQVFASPGHDNDALIFFEPHFRILISADALWGNGMGVIFPEFLDGIGFENVSLTYDLIEFLQPAIVIPGHGPVFSDVFKALSAARKKLDTYQAEPVKHAIYAAKVLIKFKLMELHQVQAPEFCHWCSNSPLLMHIHRAFFESIPMSIWIQDLWQELAERKALEIRDGLIFNL